MDTRTFLLIGLLSVLSLSGCVGDADDSLAAPDEDGEAKPLDASGEDATETGAAAPADPDGAVEPGNRTPIPTPFSWDGNVGHQVGFCAVLSCHFVSIDPWENSRDVADAGGGDLTMTWDGPQGLGLGLATRCGSIHDVYQCDFVARSEGASPLALALDDLDPDRKYILITWHPYHGIDVLGAQAGVETEFHVEGTLLVV